MNVKYLESILYYDCELLFEAADTTGQRYIAVHDRDCESGCEYIVAPASRDNMAAFKRDELAYGTCCWPRPAEPGTPPG